VEAEAVHPLFHLHIPKTGGQSFGQRLAAAFPPGAAYYMMGDLHAADPEALNTAIAGKRVVSAHFVGPVLDVLGATDIVCLVRDPVSQIVSHFLHCRREPRSIVHGLTHGLPFERALTLAGEVFFNQQARYVVGAFFARGPRDLAALDDFDFIRQHLDAALDRIRWVAPTELQDRFIDLFAIDAGLPGLRRSDPVNVAPPGDGQLRAEMTAWLRERPDLYVLDTLLHQLVARRHAAWAPGVVTRLACQAVRPGATDDRLVLERDGRSVRLGEGWWLTIGAERADREDHAGPSATARVSYCAGTDDGWLVFDVAFTVGNDLNDLAVIDTNSMRKLPVAVIRQGAAMMVAIDIRGAPRRGELAIRAARILPICAFSGDFDDADRRIAYAASRWRFEPGSWFDPAMQPARSDPPLTLGGVDT
jgi:hypothetical protein